MQQVVNINGRILPAAEATISVFDRGFLFGDSIYETLRTYNRKPFLIEQHLQRLENSARMLFMDLPMSTNQIAEQVIRAIGASSNNECYVRIIVSRGAGNKIGLDINLSKKAICVVIVVPLEPPAREYYEQGVRISVVSIRRNDVAALNPKIKSSNLLNNVLAYVHAKQQKAFEGILCNSAGNIAEGTGSNLFMVRDGKVKTPPPDAGLLEGVTRALTIDLAFKERLQVQEANFTPEELLQSDECFITSTTKEILPVSAIDDKKFSVVPGSITMKLMKAYRAFVNDWMKS
jgi:branched-chain amino acid aminotransferase